MRQVNSQTREQVFERDNYTCRYCGSKEGPFHADHVYPYSKGGETSIDNLVTACQKCNAKKQAKIGLWPKPIGYFEKPKVDKSPYVVILLSVILSMILAIYFTVEFQVSMPKAAFLLLPLVSLLLLLIIIWPESK